MRKVNPITQGRMYKVSDGGPIKGVRFNKNNTVSVLVVPAGKKRNPGKKRRKRANAKRKRKNARRSYSHSKRNHSARNARFYVYTTSSFHGDAPKALKAFGSLSLAQAWAKREAIKRGTSLVIYTTDGGTIHVHPNPKRSYKHRKRTARARRKVNRSRTRRKAANKKRRIALRRIR